MKISQSEIAGLAFGCLAERLDAGVVVRHEGSKRRATFCAVSLVACRLAVFQEERTVQIPLDKLIANKGRTFITCLLNVGIIYVVILAGTEFKGIHLVQRTPFLGCFLLHDADHMAGA